MVSLAVAAACAAGPRTTVEEFFLKHLDTSIPKLSSIPAKMSAGDVAGAEKVFADYIRATIRPEVLNCDWIGKKYSDAEIKKLKDDAEKIMDYQLSSCGTPHHFKDHKVDWELNPTFNKYKEWTWQLSRHPFWTTLAEYYTATHDERAAGTYVDMITSWFDQALVPLKAGPSATLCWRTIEAGIRMYGWSRQIHAFVKSPAATDEFLTRYFISIWEHGWRLRNNTSRGNWLLMELHGLIRISLLYPFLNDAPEWEAFALKVLRGEFDHQVYPDGFQNELATGYHYVVILNYRRVYEVYKVLGRTPPEFIQKGLENMFDAFIRIMQPNGYTPDLNDGDHMNVRATMDWAVEMYPSRADIRWIATNGREGVPPDYLSCVFPYAGAVIFRTSWARDAVWAYMDASPFGAGHQHEDKLNFTLYAYGKDMITEGGNYMYDSSDCRRYVLSTRAHNTIRINGEEQNCRKTYRWMDEDIRKKADVVFSATPKRDYATASYVDGYGKDLDMTRHERSVAFLKSEPGLKPFFVVTDRLVAPDKNARDWEAMWHLENSKFAIEGTAFKADFGGGVGLAAFVSDPGVKIVDMKGQYKPYFQGWKPIWKGGPHEHRPIPTPVVQGRFSGSHRVVTVIYPYEGGTCPIKAVRASTDVNDDGCVLVLADDTQRNVR